MSDFLEEETETQRGQTTCQGLQSKWRAGISSLVCLTPKSMFFSLLYDATFLWRMFACLFILLSVLSLGKGKFLYQMKIPTIYFAVSVPINIFMMMKSCSMTN